MPHARTACYSALVVRCLLGVRWCRVWDSGLINSPLGNPLLRYVCWQPSPWGGPEGRGYLVGEAGEDLERYSQKAERRD